MLPLPQRRYLALSGMTGTGKSAVGPRLAARVGRPCVDLDTLIAQRAGQSVPEIFKDKGEVVFRRLESEALIAALDGDPSVVALGGGTVVDLRNRQALLNQAVIITLTAPPEVIAERLITDAERGGDAWSARPLLAQTGNPRRLVARLREMTVMRARAYGESHIFVATEGLEPDAVVERILAELWALGVPVGGDA